MAVHRLSGAQSSASGFVLKGWHVLAMLIAFFGIIIATNTAFITLALGTFPGEVVKRSYVQGLDYNRTLEERRRQAALGWIATAEIVPATPGRAKLAIALVDRASQPIEGLALEGVLRRPASDEADLALTFQTRGAGLYEADLGALGPGQWELIASAARGSERLDVGARLTWSR